jgi:hypothetical protein
LQPKLTIGAPDDAYEKEADAVAEEVMSPQAVMAASGAGSDDDGDQQRRLARKAADQNLARQLLLRRVPIRTLQQTLGNRALARLLEQTLPAQGGPEVRRKCGCGGEAEAEGECAECRANRLALQRDTAGRDTGSEAPSIVEDVVRTPGQPLAESARKTFEPGFGHDFGHVRVHDDSKAAESASAVNALAYTVGSHVVFGKGQYAPGTSEGTRLLAHELTHVVQQGGVPGGGLPLKIRRQDAPTGTSVTTDDRANDPNFLLCLALCELGIPPNLWRTVVNDILGAVSQEYRDRLGDLRGSQEFESFRAGFTVMSTFNKLKLVIGFLGESRVGLLTIERPAAQALRRALLARLAALGLKSATLEVASQILRKVAIYIEVAVAAGCTTYCGAMTMTNALLDFSSAALGAISSFVSVASRLGAAIGQAIARPILVARASMDPANWNLTALPTRSQAHMQAIGLAFRLAFSPDSFVASMARPLSSYNIPQILAELAQDINATLQARGGFVQLVTFTADFIGGLTPLQFVDILKDYRLLSFLQDPDVLADQQQAQQGATPP